MNVPCRVCGHIDDLRMGVCFDCASAAEERASKRTVIQHLAHGFKYLVKRDWITARICFSWAYERATKTGDYKRGGTFESEYGGY